MIRIALTALLFATPALAAGTLRVGMESDVELLDPARSGGLPDRVVLAAVCDKLIDTAPGGDFVPQLATAWDWSADGLTLTLTLRDGVRFQDGAAMDADAVRANLERYRTDPKSFRRGELKPVASVEAADPHSVRLHLSEPYSPLVAVLADRAGMMLSPVQIRDAPDTAANKPVCAGPFRVTERLPQDRITLERFPGYWNAGAVSLDRVVYRFLPDSTVRLANLRAGALDMIERVAPADWAEVSADARLHTWRSPSIAFRLITFNVSGPTLLDRDARVRAAFAASVDRAVINQVAMDGVYVPANQFEAAGTPYNDPDIPVPPRDIDRARALLKGAGVSGRVPVSLLVSDTPLDGQVATMIQAMAADAGFDVTVRTQEAVSGTQAMRRGDYETGIAIWSGRPDPDGNTAIWLSCDGFVNFGKYCNKRMDELLAQGRRLTDPAARVPVYRDVARLVQEDVPYMVLYNPTWLWAADAKVSGFVPQADGLMRLTGVRLAQ